MHLIKSILYLSACFQASHEKKRLEESITQVVLSSMLFNNQALQPMYA